MLARLLLVLTCTAALALFCPGCAVVPETVALNAGVSVSDRVAGRDVTTVGINVTPLWRIKAPPAPVPAATPAPR